MDPVIIFAALAVLFALLNLFLWIFAWKSLSGKSGSSRKYIKELNEKNSRIEDQLWGIIDRIKELEQKIGQPGAGGENIQKEIEKLGLLSKKVGFLTQKNSQQLENINENMGNLKTTLDKFDKLKDIVEAIDDSIAWLSKKINNIENK